MLKALYKKQFLQMTAFMTKNNKTGKRHSPGKIAGLGILFGICYISLMFAFFGISTALSDLISNGNAYLYFMLMGMMCLILGVVGSVFSTTSALYQAKDNDLLLSMPISPAKILLVRMTGVYVFSLVFCSIVWIPAVLNYFITAAFDAKILIFDILLMLLITMFVTVLSCVLGWIVAWIISKVKNKSIMTVVITLGLLGAYYYVYFRINSVLQYLIANAEAIGGKIQAYVYPIFAMGKAAAGETVSMLIFAGICIALMSLCVYLLSRSFVRIVSAGSGSSGAGKGKVKIVQSSVQKALLRKETSRFLQCPTYLMNCGLGVVILIAACVVALVKCSWIREFLPPVVEAMPFIGQLIPVALAAVVCLVSGMDAVTAPSVSLEGEKYLWVLQSLPVESKAVLNAKIKLHMIVNVVPSVLTIAVVGLVLGISPLTMLLSAMLAFAFTLVDAYLGLMLDLKYPKMEWTNEAVPVKQNASVLIILFGSMIVAGLIALVYYLLKFPNADIYILCVTAIFAAVSLLLRLWMNKKGAKLFENM